MAGFQQGCEASVTIGGVVFAFDQFDIDEKNELAKTTNFTSACMQTWITGIYSGDFTCSGPYKEAAMALTLGNTYSVSFATPDLVVTNTTCILKNIKLTVKVDDAVRISCTFASNGNFTIAVT